MSLILEPSSWERSKLAELAREQLEDLRGLRQLVREKKILMPRVEDESAAAELLDSVCALAQETLRTESTTNRALANLVNVQYEAMIATLTLARKGVPKPRKGS